MTYNIFGSGFSNRRKGAITSLHKLTGNDFLCIRQDRPDTAPGSTQSQAWVNFDITSAFSGSESLGRRLLFLKFPGAVGPALLALALVLAFALAFALALALAFALAMF